MKIVRALPLIKTTRSRNVNGVMSLWAIRSQKEVGQIMGISATTVDYYEKRALQKLRRALLDHVKSITKIS